MARETCGGWFVEDIGTREANDLQQEYPLACQRGMEEAINHSTRMTEEQIGVALEREITTAGNRVLHRQARAYYVGRMRGYRQELARR